MKLSLSAIAVVVLIVGVAAFEITKDKESYIITAKKYHQNATQLRANRHQLRSGNSYIAYPSEPFVTTIEIGTSKQSFIVSLETALNGLWLGGPTFKRISEPDGGVYDPKNPNSSATKLQALSSYDGVTYYIGGDEYSDTITLFEPTNQTFISGNGYGYSSIFSLYHNIKLAGSFGLSWNVNLKDEKVTNNSAPILSLFAAAPQLPRFFVQAIGKNPTEDYSWSVTSFGSDLDKICDSNVVTSAALSSTVRPYFSGVGLVAPEFKLDLFSMKDQTAKGEWAVIDSSLPIIIITEDAFDVVYQLIQPDYDFQYGIFTTDCNGKFDDFVFKVNGVELRVPSTSYIYDIGLDYDQCALAVSYQGLFTDTPFVLGTPIQYNYCVKFDIDNSKISFQEYLVDIDEATTVSV
ncbi:hypothetical protein M3Y95_00829600 [Aphelenchoides besseyi]|nr:hypothetical protein M3Y95_00829600 [Aphelenchoides besseyi]